MKEYLASSVIDAAPERVWGVLRNAAAYPEWDPYCQRIEGEIGQGAKLKVYSKLSPGRAFPVRVTELEANRRMVWTGGMPLGLFKGVRTFSLEPKPGGATEFKLHEVFSGPMLRLIGGSLPDMTEAFEAFVSGLKRRVENGDSHPDSGVTDRGEGLSRRAIFFVPLLAPLALGAGAEVASSNGSGG